MARRKRRFYVRKWLNRPGFNTHAHVIGSIHRIGPYRAGSGEDAWEDAGTIDAFLAITDCTRTATLDFFAGDRLADEKNVIFKLDTLVKTVVDFREAWIKEYEQLQIDRGGDTE